MRESSPRGLHPPAVPASPEGQNDPLARSPPICSSRGPMRIRTLLAAAVAVAWSTAGAATALAVPPGNDNYLASLTINEPGGSLPAQFAATVDTTEATTQPDLFDPNREGLPFGGGQPEPTRCPGGPAYGKT